MVWLGAVCHFCIEEKHSIILNRSWVIFYSLYTFSGFGVTIGVNRIFSFRATTSRGKAIFSWRIWYFFILNSFLLIFFVILIDKGKYLINSAERTSSIMILLNSELFEWSLEVWAEKMSIFTVYNFVFLMIYE